MTLPDAKRVSETQCKNIIACINNRTVIHKILVNLDKQHLTDVEDDSLTTPRCDPLDLDECYDNLTTIRAPLL